MLPNFKKNTKKNPWHGFLFHLGGFLIVCILIYLVFVNVRVYQKKKEFLIQVKDLQNQIKEIQAKNNDLKQGISQANDSQYIEKVAREELNLQKPGEQAVSFIMPQNQTSTNNDANNKTNKGWLGWLTNSWDWIKSKF